MRLGENLVWAFFFFFKPNYHLSEVAPNFKAQKLGRLGEQR